MNRKNNINKKIKYKKEENNKNSFNIFFAKFFLIIILFSLCTIIVKKDSKIKNEIYNKVYNSSFSFAYFKNIYNKYIGNVIPFQNIFNEKKVFNETLEYKSLSKFNKGVKLTLENNYPIPALKGGIVIFNGEKDGKKTIIVEQYDGISVWYSNLSSVNVNLYDYIEDSKVIGEAKNNELYLLFYKNGVELDYNKVLK